VVQAIEEALQDEGLVLTRETDLEVINYFLSTAGRGILHIVMEAEGEEDQTADIECVYGMTALGEYIIQWRSDSIEDVMTNGKSYLQPTPGPMRLVPEGDPVYFSRVREVFFGQTKAFVICTPSPELIVLNKKPESHGNVE
jgi:hypothetical protein